jgi:hypothetical protein
MLGLFRPPDPDGLARARLVAAGGVGALALLALMVFIGRPTSPPPVEQALSVDQLARFQHDVPACRAALEAAGFEIAPLPDLREGARCGYADAVELTRSVHPYSGPVGGACALAAALALWERDVVGPAAAAHLGQAVTRIELAGTLYSCRPVAGRRDRRMSEHARANAVDIGGFTLANGRVIRVESAWRGRSAADRAFLRAVRDGACERFHAVLSPDYNRAHRDHLHFDLGRDKMCR